MSASATPSRPKWHLPLLWTRGIVLTIVILSAVIVFGAIGLWITQGDLIAEKASEYLNRRVFDNQQTRISLGSVSGFPMRDLRIDNALFEQKVGEDWVPFVAADTLKLEYDLWAIVNGRYQIQKVVGQGLEFRLKESPDGGYSLPALQGTSESNQPSSFALDLDALEIRDGAVELDIPGMPTKFDGVDAEMTFLVRGSQIHLDFRRFRAETFNDSLGTIAFNQGALTINPGIVMKDFDGVWNEARVQIDGIPTPAEDRPGTLQIDAVNLPLAQVGGLYNLPHLDPGHVERGEIDLRFSEAGVAFTASGAFLWEGVPIDVTEAEARLTDTSFQITALQAKAQGATVRGGTISLPRDDNSLNLSVDLEGFDPRDFEFLPENFQIPGSFTGEVNLRVPDRSRMNEYLYAVARLEAGRIYEIPYRSAFLNLQGGAATGWQIDSVLVELSDARFNGRGRYGETRTNLRLNYLGNLRPLRELLNLEELRGDGVVAATLKGPAKALRMEAQGTLWNLNVANLEIPELRLMKAAGPITGERNFEMDFETKAPFLMAGQRVNQAQGKLLLKSDRLLMDNLALSQGDTTLVVTGEMTWEPNLLIEATTAKANLGDREFVLVRPARLEFDGKRFTSPGLELETPKGKLSVGGAFEPESKYVRCSLSMEDLNPQSVLGPDIELPITFTQVSGELNLEGFIPILDGEANVRLGPLKTDKTGLDSLEASFRVRGSTVQVERITATRGGGVIGVTGEVEMPAPLYTVLEAEVFGPDLDPDATKWNLNADISDVRLSEWLSFIQRDERPYG
ncbi:MAG: hypothetical protein HKN21_16505, partial [Candidatus Eisenbacteria bacterium]|nr:hypothetical protein [Candidatus Eisenbacteria bacterium]